MKNKTALVIVAVILGAVALGCSRFMPSLGSNTANTSGPSGPAGPAPSTGEPFAPSGDVKTDLTKMSAVFMKQTVFQAVMDGSSGTMPLHMELQYNAPDRYHMKNGPSESIIIGGDMYSRTGEKWIKTPGAGASFSIDKMREAFTEEGLKRLSDGEARGEESVDGKAAYKYHFKIGAAEGSPGVPYETDLWIAKDTGLPAKIHVTYSSGNVKEMTTTYTFDPNIKVEAPIK